MANKKRETAKKCAKIQALIKDDRYMDAIEAIDGLDMEYVGSVRDLHLYADLYERVDRHEDVEKMYLLMYERTGTRHSLRDLLHALIRTGNIQKAREYFDKYSHTDDNTSDTYEISYELASAEGLALHERICILEKLKKEDYIEKWGYELAKLYHEAGRDDECIRECMDMKLWFGTGKYVQKSMELKAECDGLPVLDIPDDIEDADHTESDTYKDDDAILDTTSENVRADENAGEFGTDADGEGIAVDQTDSDIYKKPDSNTSIEEGLRAHMESESEIENEISQMIASEVSRIADDDSNVIDDGEDEDFASHDVPVVEGVGTPRTASGEPVHDMARQIAVADDLNERGQADTVGDPVVSKKDPDSLTPTERALYFDEDFEEGPADISKRGIRYWTFRDTIAKVRRGDEKPHFVLAGGEEKILPAVARRILKELNRLGYFSAGGKKNVYHITCEKLNRINLTEQLDKINGCGVLITEAAQMGAKVVDEIIRVIDEHGDEVVMMLAGPFDEMDCFLEIYPELSDRLGYKVRI